MTPTPAKKLSKEQRERACVRMYEAVGKYLVACGGSALVAGGVQIMQEPGEPKNKFSICVKILGKLPDYMQADQGRDFDKGEGK